jgi:exonuclease SbcC
MFNTTSKNERKNLNVINQHKSACSAKVELQIGDKVYTINRRSEKYVKKLKGEVTDEAKTDLDFDYFDPVLSENHSLNDTTRMKTDAAIRKHFGTIEDFLLTSMASQLDSLSFIKEGSTRRKEILAKFLDLEVFEKKYRLAKEDSADLKGVLRRIGDRNFEEDILAVNEEIKKTNQQLLEQEESCDRIKEEIEVKEAQLIDVEQSIGSIPDEVVDIIEAEKKKAALKSKLTIADEANRERGMQIPEYKRTIEELDVSLSGLDIVELERDQELIDIKQDEMESTVREARAWQKDFNNKKTKLKLLNEVPCGSEYPQCKFIHDAHMAKKEAPALHNKIFESIREAKELKKFLEDMNPDKVGADRQEYLRLTLLRSENESALKDLQILYAREKNKIVSYQSELADLAIKIEEYKDNRENIENFECLATQRQEVVDAITTLADQQKTCQNMILEYYKLKGSLEQKVTNLMEQQKELKDIQQEYAAFDLYMRCMHSNGIAYDIIKKQLPVINEEIAKVLANIVSFEAFFEDDGKRLNIFIKHPKHDARPLEMGSGAEKTIAAMAIRLALLSVSNLPKGDIFILDEPGTALDADNMEGFIRILDLIKSFFKTVILISHLDSLKDCVDTQIIIDKKGAYAHVEV